MFCPKCGTEQVSDSKYCHKCGFMVAGVNKEKENIKFKENYIRDSNEISESKENIKKLSAKRVLHIILIAIGVLIFILLLLFINILTSDPPSSDTSSSKKTNKVVEIKESEKVNETAEKDIEVSGEKDEQDKNEKLIEEEDSIETSANSTDELKNISYEDYHNSRYGFSIKYPSNLKSGDEPTNGDGLNFTNKSGNAKLTVSGINNVLDSTAKTEYEEALKEVPSDAYKAHSDNWYVLSWVENDKIIYTKKVVGKGSINTFTFQYPVGQKEIYDNFIQTLHDSFKTPGINEAH